MYNKYMKIEFNPAKDETNRAKHEVPLSLAAELEWETALIWQDARKDYGEQRMCGLALWGARLFYIAFTERGEARRVICLRKANRREVAFYVSEN